MIKLSIYNRQTKETTPIQYLDGFILTQTYNEILDSGTVIIPNVDYLNINRLDIVNIEDTESNEKINLCIGTITKEWSSSLPSHKYDYTLTLLSLNVLIQDKVLPNLTVTQPLFGDKYSIYYEMKRILDVFLPDSVITDDLKALTENVICPEFQWNRKTIFEIFNDMLTIVNAVVKVDYLIDADNFIYSFGFVSLDEKANEINHDFITEISEISDIDDYCNEIEMSAEHVISSKLNSSYAKNITPRASDYVLSTNNCKLILDKPIYQIVKVEVYLHNNFTVQYLTKNNVIKTIVVNRGFLDITKFVVEESVYNTKETTLLALNAEQIATMVNFGDYSYLKRMFISYKIGGNTIDNLTFDEKMLIGNDFGNYAMKNIITAAIYEKVLNNVTDAGTVKNLVDIIAFDDPRNLMFNIEYKSEGDLRFRVAKKNSSNLNPKLIIDSQANSYVDGRALTLAEKEKVNRLGNSELTIKMKLPSFSDLPSYGDYFNNNYYLTQGTAKIYNECIYFEGKFTKDFIRKNLFTGIRSKNRFTSIAAGSEALLRKDLIQIELKFKKTSTAYLKDLSSFIFKNFNQDENKFQLIFWAKFKNGSYSPYIAVTTSYFNIGKSAILGFKMTDNFNANNQIVDTSNTNAYTAKQVSYVDENGEFEKLSLWFCEVDNNLTQDNYTTWLEWSRKLPEFDSNRFATITGAEKIDFLAKKDNREIYAADVQLLFKSDDPDIIVYDYLTECLPFVLTGKEINIFYQLDDAIYDENDKVVKGNNEARTLESSDINNNSINYPSTQLPIRSWGLCDIHGNLLLTAKNCSKIYLGGGNKKLC